MSKKGSKAEKTLLVRPGFLFHTAPPDEKLTRDDAIFVDVIHTAGLWLGTDEPVSMKILKTLLEKCLLLTQAQNPSTIC